MGYADVSFQEDSKKEVNTPNIDTIAKDGVIFTNAYVSSGQCAPTRAGLLSGKYQQRFGFYHNRDVFDKVFLPQVTLPQVLKKYGYKTGMVGKWHLGRGSEEEYPNQRGFDEFYGFLQGMRGYLKPAINSPLLHNGKRVEEKYGYLTDFLNREAVSFVEKHSGKTPFFLYMSYNAPHYPLEAKEEYIKKFNTGNPDRDKQLAMMVSVEEGVGLVIDKLKEKGEYENTLIYFLSDNGGEPKRGADNGSLRDGKNSVYEGGPRVPFAVSWPNKIKAAQTIKQPVMSLDIFATSVAAAGGKMPEEVVFDSKNMLPILLGESNQILHDAMFWQQKASEWAVRKDNWKLVAHKKKKSDADFIYELYDLKTDIGETIDLSSKNPKKVMELKACFTEWEKQMKPLN